MFSNPSKLRTHFAGRDWAPFVARVNFLIQMFPRGSPGSRCANPDNAIFAFATPEVLLILGKSRLITSADSEFCLQAANLRKR